MRLARLEFSSTLDMLDLVEIVGDHVSRSVGFDDDTRHWVGLAVREAVINAIKHGNRSDRAKHVVVEFVQEGPSLVVRVRDRGEGFDPARLSDPLAPENLLKPAGRGIFLIRSFMDAMQVERVPDGGTELRMTKRVS